MLKCIFIFDISIILAPNMGIVNIEDTFRVKVVFSIYKQFIEIKMSRCISIKEFQKKSYAQSMPSLIRWSSALEVSVIHITILINFIQLGFNLYAGLWLSGFLRTKYCPFLSWNIIILSNIQVPPSISKLQIFHFQNIIWKKQNTSCFHSLISLIFFLA